MRMKISHITSAHPRHDVRVYLKECCSLANAGHHVSLICADGKGEEESRGVKIYDVGKPKGRSDRALNAVNRIGTLVRTLRPDFVHFHDPELIGLGVWFSCNRIKVIYDAHEDVPADIVTKAWIPRGLRGATARGMDLAEKAGARFFHRIVTATPAIARRFPKSKTLVIQNYPLLSEFSKNMSAPYNDRPPIFAYAGAISLERGFKEMIAAAELAATSKNLHLRLAGNFAEPVPMQEMIADRQAILYEGMLNRADTGRMLSEARAGLVLFQPHKNHVDAQPTKLFEYMSAGIPVIASNFPLWQDIINGGQCGICVNPRSVPDIANAMLWILRNPHEAKQMGERGKKLVLERYNWETQIPMLMSIYQDG